MSGTKHGAKTTKQRHGKNFYKIAGAKGGNPMLLKVRDQKLRELKNGTSSSLH